LKSQEYEKNFLFIIIFDFSTNNFFPLIFCCIIKNKDILNAWVKGNWVKGN